ncbi:MAG: PA14 domain-containing protein [Saprospiraceae bacterium]
MDFELDPLCKGKCGMIWKGYVLIEQTGGYKFWTESDDGSLLFIDGDVVVDNDGDHGMAEQSGLANLKRLAHVQAGLFQLGRWQWS